MPSASAISGCASCSSVKDGLHVGELSAKIKRRFSLRRLRVGLASPAESDLPSQLPPFPSQRLLDGAPVAAPDAAASKLTASASFSSRSPCSSGVAQQLRNGSISPSSACMPLRRPSAIAALTSAQVVLVRGVKAGNGSGGSKAGAWAARQSAEQGASGGRRPERIARADLPIDHARRVPASRASVTASLPTSCRR